MQIRSGNPETGHALGYVTHVFFNFFYIIKNNQKYGCLIVVFQFEFVIASTVQFSLNR